MDCDMLKFIYMKTFTKSFIRTIEKFIEKDCFERETDL